MDAGVNANLDRVTLKFFGEDPVMAGRLSQVAITAKLADDVKQFSPGEFEIYIRYNKQLYLVAPGLESWLSTIVKDHDVITCEYPFYASLLSDFCRRSGKPLIVTSHDALYELHGTQPMAKEHLRKKEIESLRMADARVFCNDKERILFGGFGLDGVTVISTGDALRVAPGESESAGKYIASTFGVKTPHYCFFVGSNFVPNIEAVAEIRKLAGELPNITFVVAGQCSPKLSEKNVIALGEVSSEVLDKLYRGAFAVLVPMRRGTGISVKIFEAFTYGKVVVSTAIGMRGYDVLAGEHFLLAEEISSFKNVLESLLADAGLRTRIETRAREYALAMDYRRHFKPYAEIISRLAKKDFGDGVPAVKLVVVDNNLSSRVGHHYNYALSLKHECGKEGFRFASLVNNTAPSDVLSELDAVAVFRQGIHEKCPENSFPPDWQPMHGVYDFLLSSDIFSKELAKGLADRASVHDLVFLPNATPAQILGLALLLARSPLYRELNYVLIVRYSLFVTHGPLNARKVELDKQTAERYVMAFDRLVHADRGARVRIATDSAELAREFSSIVPRKIEILPIPHTAPAQSSEPGGVIPEKKPGRIRIIYCGDAREEKGFELLAPLARALATGTWRETTECVFQAFVSSNYHQRMNTFIGEMERLKQPNLVLVREPLSADSYQRLLASADLVLIPYDAATYRSRTSGPFVEAICAGKPVVVPNNSWMQAQLGASGGGMVFSSGNAQEFVRAVHAACAEIKPLREAAEVLGRRFREFHNPHNFVRQLLRC